jgi:hypothetical protein
LKCKITQVIWLKVMSNKILKCRENNSNVYRIASSDIDEELFYPDLGM